MKWCSRRLAAQMGATSRCTVVVPRLANMHESVLELEGLREVLSEPECSF